MLNDYLLEEVDISAVYSRKKTEIHKIDSTLLNEYKHAAYHRSGQIVIAYFSGYECETVDLNKEIETKTSFLNYKKDTYLVNSILEWADNPDKYKSLPANIKIKAHYVAHRIASVIIAGSVASAMFKHNFELVKNKKIAVEINAADFERINDIQLFLASEKNIDIPDFVEKTINYTLDLFHQEVWKSVESLAKKFTKTQYHFVLSRKLIENNLYLSGLMSYIESVKLNEVL
jgi:hypothetical protein